MKTLDTTYTSNPTAQNTGLSADDYTAFLEGQRVQRTLTNIARRADNLWSDGYRLEDAGETDTFRHFIVLSPKADRYSVTLSDTPNDELFGDHCSCPCFEKLNTCKHLLAVKMKDTEDREADAEWERMEELRNFFDTRYDDY